MRTRPPLVDRVLFAVLCLEPIHWVALAIGAVFVVLWCAGITVEHQK